MRLGCGGLGGVGLASLGLGAGGLAGLGLGLFELGRLRLGCGGLGGVGPDGLGLHGLGLRRVGAGGVAPGFFGLGFVRLASLGLGAGGLAGLGLGIGRLGLFELGCLRLGCGGPGGIGPDGLGLQRIGLRFFGLARLGLCPRGPACLGLGVGGLGIGRLGRSGTAGLGSSRFGPRGFVSCRRPVVIRLATVASGGLGPDRGGFARFGRFTGRRGCRRQGRGGRRLGGGHHADFGRRYRRRCRFELRALCFVDRRSRLGGELLLLRCKGQRCGRRRGASDNGLRQQRWFGDGLARAALQALLDRRNAGHTHHRRADDRVARQGHRGLGHRLRLHERLRRHRDHRPRHLLVGIDHVGDVGGVVDDGRVGRDVGGVVDVGDGLRRNHGIAAIDVVEVAAADRVRGLIHLARRQRKPAHRCGARAARRDRDLEVLAADEGHQGRRVHRPLALGPGHPGPAAVDVGPATVVRNGVAPGRVIDPGPAPGIDPGPVPVAVGRPARGDASRCPDIAIVGVDAPTAVGVEVFVADDFARDIACRHRALAAPVALARPAVQVVVATRRQGFVVGQIAAVEAVGAARIDGVRRALPIYLGHAALHRDGRRIVVGIDLDAVVAGAAQREGQVRRRDFEGLPRPQAAHAQLQAALSKLHLGDAIVEVEQDHAGGRTHADRRAADLQLGARVGPRPQAIAGGERPIDGRPYPIGLPGRRETHAAAEVAQACCARWRFRRGQPAQGQQQSAGKHPDRAA